MYLNLVHPTLNWPLRGQGVLQGCVLDYSMPRTDEILAIMAFTWHWVEAAGETDMK